MFAYKVTSVALALYLQWMCIIIFFYVGSTTHSYKPTCSGRHKQKIKGRGINYLQPLAGSNVFNLFFLSSTPKNRLVGAKGWGAHLQTLAGHNVFNLFFLFPTIPKNLLGSQGAARPTDEW